MFSCQLSLLVIKLSDDCCSGILSSCNVLLSVVSVSNKVGDDCCSGILSVMFSCQLSLLVIKLATVVVPVY